MFPLHVILRSLSPRLLLPSPNRREVGDGISKGGRVWEPCGHSFWELPRTQALRFPSNQSPLTPAAVVFTTALGLGSGDWKATRITNRGVAVWYSKFIGVMVAPAVD